MSKRLAAAISAAKGQALSIYLAAGHPDPDASFDFFDAAIQGGAHWIEFGIPFSDPAADGPVIEAAANQALAAGTTPASALALARRVRDAHPDVPLIAMTYANLAFQMSWDGFAQALADAGLDGAILPDVPLEESGPARAALEAHGLAWIPLVTPTTPAERMTAILETASPTGFAYVVSNVGITGQSDPGPLVEATVERARAAGTSVPLAVGFGIASAEDVRRVLAAGADAAIVGSHIVGQISNGATPDQIRNAVAALRP